METDIESGSMTFGIVWTQLQRREREPRRLTSPHMERLFLRCYSSVVPVF